jgi:hypothetical protein
VARAARVGARRGGGSRGAVLRPAPIPGFQRVECRCGCGAWWYAAKPVSRRGRKGEGRPREFLNPDHAQWARNRKRRLERKRAQRAA